ncbi:putative uncharacterized protein [Clostridium sp. CAG:122]|uniref:AAA family ATPase n=1 Tax=Butyribacter TaxID=2822463 RepID=UPI00033A98BD|nr:putative uncharacterized protein [Clostridium sp. CAG:122]
MVSKIHVSALKSIKNLEIECSGLNLLVGRNSSGKSTFLQALLLYAQRKLDGKYISVGEFREARNYNMPNEKIRIELYEKNKTKPDWIEFIEDKENDSYNINSCIENYNLKSLKNLMGKDNDLEEQAVCKFDDSNFHYLSCHRIGVNDIYKKNMINETDFGIDGEYALAYLLKNEGETVKEDLIANDPNFTSTLLGQVNYWMNYIVDTSLLLTDLKKTNYLQVKYNNNPKNKLSDALYCRPINIGSGVSYLISIIISCLASNRKDVIIIENPEIHLHPKAQSRLCEFLYFISKTNRQIFVETHSDHIFNGLRVGIATKYMKQEDISVNFFALDEKNETQCNHIVFGDYGKVIGTNNNMDINDLFDQFDIDLDRMLGI